MAFTGGKRRRDGEEDRKPKKKVWVKKQKRYHSSSEDESDGETFRARDAPSLPKKSAPKTPPLKKPASKSHNVPALSKPKSILKATQPSKPETSPSSPDSEEENSEEELATNTAWNAAELHDDDDALGDEGDSEEDGEELEEEDEDDDLSEADASVTSSQAARSKKKRNDPSAFATSISKILDTKLTSSKRADPVLSRSKSAAEANKTLANDRLEAKARAQIRSEKKATLERGRVRDVLGVNDSHVDSGALMEEEKRLKKTAQRGVVKLFNAVRAAQVKAEEGMKQARKEGVVGMRQREEKVNEMSKQGFLDLISSGGKTTAVS